MPAEGMRLVYKGSEVIGFAVKPRGSKEIHAIVSPTVAPHKIRHRHHLDRRDPQPRQFFQLPHGRLPIADLCEGTDVHLVNDEPLAIDSTPCPVRPRETSRIDDARGAFRTKGLKSRSGIWKRALDPSWKLVECAPAFTSGQPPRKVAAMLAFQRLLRAENAHVRQF